MGSPKLAARNLLPCITVAQLTTLRETIPVRIDTTGQIGEIDHPPGAGAGIE